MNTTWLGKTEKALLSAFALALIVFTAIFIAQKNFEFIAYVIVVLVLAGAVFISHKRVRYPAYVLWGLFAWGVLHMLGGVAMTSGEVVYTKMLWPLVGEPYNILKYDQLIHAFGFFVATLVMFYVLQRYLTRPFSWTAVGIVVAMAGLGLGALNEIIEFLMVVTLPNTNVGGYENTALDLVFNFAGAVLAVFYLKFKSSPDGI